MATGYGYVRDAKPMQINWGEVGQKMTDAISGEVQDRQNRKDEIDKQLNDYQKNLLDQPQGTNAESNRFMGDFTSDAGDAMRQAERLLKGGNLSERDFYKFRANANQGTDLMFQAAKNFNEGYDESMRRFSDGESQSKENWMRQQTEGYLNFSNNGAYINPLTGEVNVARRNKETGEISTRPGDFANVSELVQQSKAQYNKFDLQGSINASVKGLTQRLVQDSDGRTTKQFYQSLQEGDLGDAEQALLDKAKADMVASFTVNPDNVSSILTENVAVTPDGVTYDFTYDEQEAKNNPHLILVNPDGTNNFDTPNGKKQLEAANKYAEAQFEAALGGERKEAPDKTVTSLSSGDKKSKSLRNKEIGYLKSIDNVISGDTSTAQASIDAMIQGANVIYGKSPGIQNIKNAQRSEDGKTLTVTRINSKGGITEAIPYDISDPNKAGEVMVELFFPNVKGSYEELLTDYNKQGGFTTRKIENPNYDPNDVDDKGVPNQQRLIDNPNYRGASVAGKTEAQVTIEQDFNSAEVLGEKTGDEKPLKDIIADVDMSYKFSDPSNASLQRASDMAQNAENAFQLLKRDLPNLDVRSRATTSGLELTIPSIFEGTLLLPSNNTDADKANYIDAIKQIFNSIAKGTAFDKSIFE